MSMYFFFKKFQNPAASARAAKAIAVVFFVFSFCRPVQAVQPTLPAKSEIPEKHSASSTWEIPAPSLETGSIKFNVMIAGLDSYNSLDVIMVAHYDFEGRTATIISIPKETYIVLPGHSFKAKIKEAFSYGASEMLVSSVEKLLKIKIDYFITLDLASVEKIVNSVGGIEIKPTQLDSKAAGASRASSTVPLDGKQAIEFGKRLDSNEDIEASQIKRQQQIIKAFIQKAFTPQVIPIIPKLAKYFLGSDSYKTNISMREAYYLTRHCDKEMMNNMKFKTLPCKPETINGEIFMIADENYIKNDIRKIFGEGY